LQGKFPIVPRQQHWQQSFLFRNPIYQKQVDAVDFEDLQARFGAITMIRKTGSSGGERKTGSSGGFGSQVASRGKNLWHRSIGDCTHLNSLFLP
jgi:hypothetical protein